MAWQNGSWAAVRSQVVPLPNHVCGSLRQNQHAASLSRLCVHLEVNTVCSKNLQALGQWKGVWLVTHRLWLAAVGFESCVSLLFSICFRPKLTRRIYGGTQELYPVSGRTGCFRSHVCLASPFDAVEHPALGALGFPDNPPWARLRDGRRRLIRGWLHRGSAVLAHPSPLALALMAGTGIPLALHHPTSLDLARFQALWPRAKSIWWMPFRGFTMLDSAAAMKPETQRGSLVATLTFQPHMAHENGGAEGQKKHQERCFGGARRKIADRASGRNPPG